MPIHKDKGATTFKAGQPSIAQIVQIPVCIGRVSRNLATLRFHNGKFIEFTLNSTRATTPKQMLEMAIAIRESTKYLKDHPTGS